MEKMNKENTKVQTLKEILEAVKSEVDKLTIIMDKDFNIIKICNDMGIVERVNYFGQQVESLTALLKTFKKEIENFKVEGGIILDEAIEGAERFSAIYYKVLGEIKEGKKEISSKVFEAGRLLINSTPSLLEVTIEEVESVEEVEEEPIEERIGVNISNEVIDLDIDLTEEQEVELEEIIKAVSCSALKNYVDSTRSLYLKIKANLDEVSKGEIKNTSSEENIGEVLGLIQDSCELLENLKLTINGKKTVGYRVNGVKKTKVCKLIEVEIHDGTIDTLLVTAFSYPFSAIDLATKEKRLNYIEKNTMFLELLSMEIEVINETLKL